MLKCPALPGLHNPMKKVMKAHVGAIARVDAATFGFKRAG